ncbi:PriCT-2 domain-containing protein [Paraburkholderia sp. BL10I2N1]|uniref:PriCT-2 domain-containing protein n=1 Tax=Paraburkholderia sp. BL10I2N1 TaxID=1938796 RepID=UPI001060D116|nr:PriCT-2 domain-containing protein [Paraburkholderia sp. BL10I2N1]TDN67164.1 putative DNA primase/helicase [Paraburkholderia sp. BL10I2N1]
MSTRYISEADRVRAALAVIPAEDYATWLDMAFAVKHGLGEAGFEIWDTWSRSASNYDGRAARATWRSVRESGGRTLGSLFWLAEQHGFDLKGSGTPEIDMAGSGRDRAERATQAREADQAEEEARARHAAAAREAVSIWQWARPVGPQHPYLVHKDVMPVNTLRELEATELRALLGYAPKSADEVLSGRVLIVPVRIGDALSTLELIDEQGRKSALAGGAKGGGYWMTDIPPAQGDHGDPILIAEGVATALSAHRATGWFAVAALSSGNLRRVARTWRERYPDADLLVLADLGPGQERAEHAATDASARLALPVFAPHARIADVAPTDFNDMAVLAGLEAVGDVLREAAYRHVAGSNEADLPRPDEVAWVTVEQKQGERKEDRPMGRLKQDAGEGAKRGAKEAKDVSGVDLAEGAMQGAGQPAVSNDGATRALSRREAGAPLYGLDEVPGELKALAQHRFGAQIRMATPRENGGPYRGEVFNTEHYLIQEVATRSVVFHAKERMEFVSGRLKWCDENQRLNGADVQIGYDGDRPRVYPWDRARDQLERTVASLKKSAHELGLGEDVAQTLEELQARSWSRIREARAAALEQSKERPARDGEAAPDR